MRKNLKLLFITGLFFSVTLSCVPDRMAPDPVENTRPNFVGFDSQTSHTLNKPLNGTVKMIFNEKMDI